MAVTEAEVKRLLADATGKRLHATRLASLEKLRAHLVHEARKSVAVTAAIDGLLAIATDSKQPADVRVRAGDVLGLAIDLDALRGRFRAWPSAWTTRLRALGRDPSQPAPARLLALRALETRVLEEEGLAEVATDLFIEVLSRANDPIALRTTALHALAEIHRGARSFFADERRIGGLATVPLPSWEDWDVLSPDERAIAAALADPDALADAIVSDSPAALEAVALHVTWDPSSARLLAARLCPLIAEDPAIEPVHAALLRKAVDHDRAHAELSLDGIAPAIIAAAAHAGRRALATGDDAVFEAHAQLWNDLFRDDARGLRDHLLARLRAAPAIDEDVAGAWVALHALGGERAAEGDRRGLELVKKSGAARGLDALVARVVPEVVLELQEGGLLGAIDVPTEDERARLYRGEETLLPRRVRLAHLASVLERAEEPSRVSVALDLLPGVIRWLPSEMTRFEPILRALFGVASQRRLRGGARPAFDALARMLEALARVAPGRRRTARAHLARASGELARQARVHGLPAAALATALARVVPDAGEARALWTALVKDTALPVDERLDAWHALDAWTDADDALGELLEEVLTGTDGPEIGPFLIEPFRRRWPVRFATVAAELHLAVPPVERVSAEARDAIAAAVSAEEVLACIETGEPLAELLGAMLLVRGVVARRPDLRARARAALARRVDDDRVYEPSGDVELVVSAVAFSEQLALGSGDDPNAAAEALARVLAALDDPSAEDLARATELARRFAASATSPMQTAAVTTLERDLDVLLARVTPNVEALEAIVGAYCEAIALLGDAHNLRDRLERVMTDPALDAGARYAAFAVLSAAKDVDREALVDDAVGRFFDRAEDPAFRALLGGVVTIARPQAFASIVDMNLQPWAVLRPEDASLPANNLPGNMPMSWLVATLAGAAHVAPIRRAAEEIAGRLVPENDWEWGRVRTFWLGLVKTCAADVRRGLRLAAAVDSSAGGLLALFGNDADADLLARAAGLVWIEDRLADDVFWRPAGKAPAFGRYSFLEPWLEAAFGTAGRYRILSEAYVLEAERAEGGDGARYAYEAFLLGPDNPRAAEILQRLGG